MASAADKLKNIKIVKSTRQHSPNRRVQKACCERTISLVQNDQKTVWNEEMKKLNTKKKNNNKMEAEEVLCKNI